jgi:hypothetical protein
MHAVLLPLLWQLAKGDFGVNFVGLFYVGAIPTGWFTAGFLPAPSE